MAINVQPVLMALLGFVLNMAVDLGAKDLKTTVQSVTMAQSEQVGFVQCIKEDVGARVLKKMD